MSKVALIRLAKALRQRLNIITGKQRAPFVSYSRRINRVATSQRICAMTFDDGPMRLNPRPSSTDKSLTEVLLETLEKHNARGTFDVIGTTANNYPDRDGKLGTPSWSGVKFDHYPCFLQDGKAGAVNCPDIIDRIIKGGHQITNHTYSHVLYGKKNIIYSKRHTLSSFSDAKSDLLKLDKRLQNKHGYKMGYSRPPHYVDRIEKGLDAYDLYALTGYQYLGASFDGAGWLPCSSYEEELQAMTQPLENALKNDPNALCGQIIFQKDGFNMGLRTPVADALDKQLDILDYYGYRVVTVDELFEEYPFTDIGEYDVDFELFREISKTHAVVYNDNRLRPDELMTLGELAMLIAPRKYSVDKRIQAIRNGEKRLGVLPSTHAYSGAIDWAVNNNLLKCKNPKDANRKIVSSDLDALGDYIDKDKLLNENLTRRNVLKALSK